MGTWRRFDDDTTSMRFHTDFLSTLKRLCMSKGLQLYKTINSVKSIFLGFWAMVQSKGTYIPNGWIFSSFLVMVTVDNGCFWLRNFLLIPTFPGFYFYHIEYSKIRTVFLRKLIFRGMNWSGLEYFSKHSMWLRLNFQGVAQDYRCKPSNEAWK